jgi:hypothetical protein
MVSQEELLLEVLQRLAVLEGAIARLSPSPRVSRRDLERLTRLLPQLEAAFHTQPFTARDVAQRQPTLGSPKQIGKYLARVKNVWLNARAVEQVGVEGHAILWRITTIGVPGVTERFKAA